MHPRVLVVDDSLTVRMDLRDVLEADGFEVVVCGSWAEARGALADSQLDLAVLDLTLPDEDGFEFLAELRAAQESVPLLLLSSEAELKDRLGNVERGRVESVGKPYDAARVVARARQLVEAPRTAGALALAAGPDANALKAPPEHVPSCLEAPLRSTPEPTPRRPGRSLPEPERVLAVDDSATYLGELADRLRSEGYDVTLARRGEEALALLETQRVDAILLDLVMPGLSGMETCRRVKATKELRTIPLILMTAHDGHDAMLEGIEAGADDYVAKTSDLEVLVARLRAQLRQRRFEEEHRRVHTALLKQEAETRAAREHAAEKAELSKQLESKNALLAANARDLAALNAELEGFAYSVSHDLRQPLRSLDGFSRVLLESHTSNLDDKGRHYLERIRQGAQRMALMIDGLLTLSRVTRTELDSVPVRLDTIAERVLRRLQETEPARSVDAVVEDGLECAGDPALLECLLENLLGNAWKFTAHTESAQIRVGADRKGEEVVFSVRDNGAGFDMRYADKLFGPFQRLHSVKEFAGTGIGLATVQRIVRRHGGRVWAESAPNAGATFCFTLPTARQGGPREP